ncbi:GldL-related protein [Hymenobacter rigui]|uniref:Gliding motility protein GldL-like N-terminal domain-containing protein n=1 Tax=Hymenobacter rigui TaxID=334424 RepID=A0A428K9P4_9BACT|nr:hypothetical protein [Hymenobacter rigui]RSK43219.1 hypothetical protein EI291_22030 [Hymenobacter rigui]
MKTALWLAVSVFILGFGLILLGSLFRIQHWTGGSVLLVTGTVLQSSALVILVVQFRRNYRSRQQP